MNFVQSTQEIRFGETLFVSQGVKNQVQVLKAFWKDLVVAVKIYRNARIEDHQQEINYLMKLSGIHSSFLDFYGYFRENECVYIVMEFCEMTLNDLVIKISEREIFLEDEKVFGIVDDLIHTFAVLESFKVYHRDIKPENIVVSKDFKVKIIDFNISESLEYLESKSEISLRSTIGTMGYMSPELKRFNNQGLTQACFNLALSDVYSLGIVLMIVFIKKNHSNQGLFQQEEFVKNRILEIKNPVYKSILESMLQQDPLKRKTFQEISNSLKINHFSLPFGPVTSSFLISSRNILKRNNFFEEQQCLTLMKHDTTCLKFSKDFSPDGKVLAYSLKYLKDKISGIPDLVSAYEEDGQTFVMTENLGYSLERCLIEWKKHGSRFNIFEVYSWFRPIVNVVWNSFQQGFHFNAISDANLFLNSQSQVKIVGFSRSWDLRYLPTQEFITACYSHCFTPPEVIKDLVERRAICEYDCEKADVYALGIVFYQFLTFDNASEIWFNKDSMYLEGKIKNFDTFTADLLRKMLESDPSKRLNLNQLVKMINFS